MDIIAGIIKDLVQEHYRYISECEAESTETERQIALIKEKTKELQVRTELAEAYFLHQMQSGKDCSCPLLRCWTRQIELGNMEIAQIALRTIEIVRHKSPFSF